MPTYDYECPKCGHKFEKFQGINDPPVKTCPKCRGRKVKRLIGTGAGILFKGSGFHATDYRSKEYSRAAKSDSSAWAKTEGGAKPETAAKGEKPKGEKSKGEKPKEAKAKPKSGKETSGDR